MLSKIKKAFKYFRAWVEKNIFTLPFRFKRLKNVILFESLPDLSDNTKAVFDEMIARGLNNKYRLIWLVHNKNVEIPLNKNVEKRCFLGNTFRERMSILKLKFTAKVLISCNYFLLTERKGQKSFYLGHGSPIKSVRGYYTMPQKIDYALVAADEMVEIIAYEMEVSKTQLFSLGYPRNDILCCAKDEEPAFFESGKFKKNIVWYPTFRQHTNGGKNLTKNALPIIHDQEVARKLNAVLVENEVAIYVKPHFAQDLTYIKELKLSNIIFINDDYYKEKGISSYKFIGACDALLTDYSSVYYDYTLCNKPVALIWEDYEEYRKSVGFAKGIEEYMDGAEKIYTLDDLIVFIKRVITGEDLLSEKREEIKNRVNYAADGKSTQRVVDFILDKAYLLGENE